MECKANGGKVQVLKREGHTKEGGMSANIVLDEQLAIEALRLSGKQRNGDGRCGNAARVVG